MSSPYFALQTVKRVAMQSLAERSIPKTDPRFRDLWNQVQRGTVFAFVGSLSVFCMKASIWTFMALQRDEIASRVLRMREILDVVDGHLDMYLR